MEGGKKMIVLVCDDEEERCDEVVEAIKTSGVEGVEVRKLVGPALRTELSALFDRVDAFLKDPTVSPNATKLSLDSADLVLFDNNLAHLEIKGARLTAESVVGYVRGFTRATYIVSLNKNSDVDFDLRYLVGDYETRADVALNTDHLNNLALWTGHLKDAKDEFLPWYWPRLIDACANRLKQIQFVRDHLEKRVYESLGLSTDDGELGFQSRHARGALSPDAHSGGGDAGKDAIPIDALTFRDVFNGKSRSLPGSEDRRLLSSANTSAANEVIARIVAADVDLWFRRDVVGPQDALVDVPHLLSRMPFLLGSSASNLKAWNSAVSSTDPTLGLDSVLFETHLKQARFAHDIWLRTPAFRWPLLKIDEKLEAFFFRPHQGAWPDVVFCEDLSRFVPRVRKDSGPNPDEFTAEFEGSWARRYVAKLEKKQYKPQSRFAV